MPEIASVRWHHDMVIDTMIAQPQLTQNEIADMFGFSAAWLSIVINSSAFQERLEARKAELVDPLIRLSVEDRIRGVAAKAWERIAERLETNFPMSTKDLTDIADKSSKAIGFGPQKNAPAPAADVNLYVVAAPPAAPSSDAWVAAAGGRVIDVTPKD